MRRALLALTTVLAAAACGDDDAAAPDAALEPDMVAVPAGTVSMGDPGGAADEQPVRTVTVSAFQIDKLEASQSEWMTCLEAGACGPVICQDSPYWNPVMYPEFPAICMTWAQARDYCAWRGKRLPTEAEWERAARADDGRSFAWGNDAPDCEHANFFDCGHLPEDVDLRPAGASPFGALNMTGNVREWTADFYAADAYATQPDVDPAGPASGENRVVRGGHFNMTGPELRAAARDQLLPIAGAYELGVRCAK